MKHKVKLSDILEGMGFQSEENSPYLDTRTGEVVFRGDDSADFEDLDDEEGEEEIDEDHLLALPTQFEIHEYDIMREFCESIEDRAIWEELQDAIRGSGAFRRFKDAIQRHGIAERWYAFRDEALKEIAVDWCKSNHVRYIDDTRRDASQAEAERASKKAAFYEELLTELRSVLEGERDPIANAANTAAVLYQAVPQVSWAGFYFLRGEELVVGPFQGKPACTRIALGKGVCGTAAAEHRSIVVPNVHEFPGHIACDPASNSEIVVPILRGDRLIGVLDLDSTFLDRFDEADRAGLEAAAREYVQATEFPAD